MKELKWAVLGCGVIANQLAEAMEKHGRKLYAVGNRTHDKALKFAEKYGIEHVYDDYEAMFIDREVDIIYITTPHNTHIQFLRKALGSGKHVLCEKSITLNSTELEEAVKLAEDNHVVFAEAMTLFHMPLYKKLDELVNGGSLGAVNLITMNFGSYKEYDMKNRFYNRSLAGGSMLDIGVYAISFTRWFLKSTPDEILSQVKFAPTKVDEKATILMSNQEQQMVTIALSLHSKQPKRGMISCDKAFIEVMEFPRAMQASITYTESGLTEVIQQGDTLEALWYEVEDMEAAVSGHGNQMHLDYTRDVMEIMTRIRKEWGMTYPEEE